MKFALSMMTIPFTLSFLSGVFNWYIEDGMFILFGFSMMVGLIWAWVEELKR